MPRVAKRCQTITGVTLQQFAERMSERQAKEALKILVKTVETNGMIPLDFEFIDKTFRLMVE